MEAAKREKWKLNTIILKQKNRKYNFYRLARK